MAETETIRRVSPLDGLTLLAAPGVALLSEAPPAARHLLRLRAADIAAAGEVIGLALPTTPCRAVAAGERAALWLGPDEWLILSPPGDDPAATIARRLGGRAHSCVDVSQRQLGIVLDGPLAADVLAAGCPLDLDPVAFPVGMCTRTLLAKAEIVLWRVSPATFRIEVGRSFAPYLAAFLREAARGLRAADGAA